MPSVEVQEPSPLYTLTRKLVFLCSGVRDTHHWQGFRVLDERKMPGRRLHNVLTIYKSIDPIEMEKKVCRVTTLFSLAECIYNYFGPSNSPLASLICEFHNIFSSNKLKN